MPTVKTRKYNSDTQWPDTLHPLLQRIYSARGIRQAEELELELRHLLPPAGLKGINEAVSLLAEAIEQQRNILIVGDFDADGATSTALAVRALRLMGGTRVDYLVPNRFEYGYGLTPAIVELAISRAPHLIVTVDNGISSHAGIELARKHGIEVLVTDHHLPGNELPAASAIVNPNQPGDEFASKSLAGVGVIFYVLLALRASFREHGWFARQHLAEPNLAEFLDIVALGTVADVVPLDRNNRILVNAGLSRIRAGRCVAGITALLQLAGRQQQRVTASDLGFAVGPRLNAAGRLDDMSVGIACLLADDEEAYSLAAMLDSYNRERRQIEADMQIEAQAFLDELQVDKGLPFGLALYHDNWHQGVIGILASRIKEKLHRPVIVFAPAEDGLLKGSGRSIHGIHLRDVLEAIDTRNPGIMRTFGGHAMAAGLSLDATQLKRFKQLFDQQVAAVSSPELLESVIYTDGQLPAEWLNLETVELLENAGPWGQAFPEPVFSGRFRVIQQRVLKQRHIKLLVSHADQPAAAPQTMVDAIAFNYLDATEEETQSVLPDTVQLVFKPAVNHFRGEQNLQLIVDHILV